MFWYFVRLLFWYLVGAISASPSSITPQLVLSFLEVFRFISSSCLCLHRYKAKCSSPAYFEFLLITTRGHGHIILYDFDWGYSRSRLGTAHAYSTPHFPSHTQIQSISTEPQMLNYQKSYLSLSTTLPPLYWWADWCELLICWDKDKPTTLFTIEQISRYAITYERNMPLGHSATLAGCHSEVVTTPYSHQRKMPTKIIISLASKVWFDDILCHISLLD